VTASLGTFDWHRFLARTPLAAPAEGELGALRDQAILITGAGGSIGSALALRLAALRPRELVLLDHSESRLCEVQRALENHAADTPTAFLLGSVGDSILLEELFARRAPTLIFHAAAFKHVPLLEGQPFAAIENNVFGTATLVDAAGATNARVVLVSTDKAVAPASIMGASKRIAEHIVHAAGGTVVRLANVLASSDSVAEIFARQLMDSEPLPVTDPAARRYFVTIDEAVNLLLAATLEPRGEGAFVPALEGQHFIADLARFMAQMLAPERELSIQFTAPRPGDKECEQLWSSAETTAPAHARTLLALASPQWETAVLERRLGELRRAVEARDLPHLLSAVRSLVPDYVPGSKVLGLIAEHAAQPVARVAP
jgi:FlaA1/EpsC-like NDP-sugar epimerase